MALPTYTVSGTVNNAPLVWNLNYAVQATALPPIHTAAIFQTTENTIAQLTYGNGTTAGLATKVVLAAGSQTTGTSVTSVLDLQLALDASGMAAAGLTHLRELWIFNDGLTAGFSAAGDTYFTWDLSLANSWGVGAVTAGFIASGTPAIMIPNGTYFRVSKPYGTAGWVVDATHKLIGLSTPAQATTSYRIVALGDSA